MMRRSRLEMCLDILEVLNCRFPVKLTHIMNKIEVNCSVLKDCLVFLTKQGLVENKTVGKERRMYAITQLGITVLKEFKDLKEVFPIGEEKRNEKQFL
jgi:predicted transcriptional regulator